MFGDLRLAAHSPNIFVVYKRTAGRFVKRPYVRDVEDTVPYSA